MTRPPIIAARFAATRSNRVALDQETFATPALDPAGLAPSPVPRRAGLRIAIPGCCRGLSRSRFSSAARAAEYLSGCQAIFGDPGANLVYDGLEFGESRFLDALHQLVGLRFQFTITGHAIPPHSYGVIKDRTGTTIRPPDCHDSMS
ncbi:hypothetical protein EMIT0111MI5_70077 [Burkholderia sp. IT-111MI5]